MKSFLRAVSRFSASLLILIFVSQCLFPHVDVLAATYRQKALRLTLSKLMDEEQKKPQIRLMAQVLDLLPREHYEDLLKIDYNPRATHLPRGMAKSDHLIINSFQIDDNSEFTSVFIHEIGHVADLGYLTDPLNRTEKSHFYYPNGKSVEQFDPSLRFYMVSWNDSHSKKNNDNLNFISTYGMSNPFEEFAESYNFFVLHRENFYDRSRENIPLRRKYNFLKHTVFKDQEFDFYSAENYPKVIYDTTLLPFDLNKLVLYAEERDDRRRVNGRTRVRRQARFPRKILVKA